MCERTGLGLIQFLNTGRIIQVQIFRFLFKRDNMEVWKIMTVSQVGGKGTIYIYKFSKEKWKLKKGKCSKDVFLCTAEGMRLGKMSSAPWESSESSRQTKGGLYREVLSDVRCGNRSVDFSTRAFQTSLNKCKGIFWVTILRAGMPQDLRPKFALVFLTPLASIIKLSNICEKRE